MPARTPLPRPSVPHSPPPPPPARRRKFPAAPPVRCCEEHFSPASRSCRKCPCPHQSLSGFSRRALAAASQTFLPTHTAREYPETQKCSRPESSPHSAQAFG